MRISSEEYYLKITKPVDSRCLTIIRKYGEIIFKSDNIVSGYKMLTRKSANCEEAECIKEVVTIDENGKRTKEDRELFKDCLNVKENQL
jgi:deoxycytidylate deaminase